MYSLILIQNGQRFETTVEGTEAAYDAYKFLKQGADIIPGLYVSLVDMETGEILADNEDDM